MGVLTERRRICIANLRAAPSVAKMAMLLVGAAAFVQAIEAILTDNGRAALTALSLAVTFAALVGGVAFGRWGRQR
jgi:hypothetical protein